MLFKRERFCKCKVSHKEKQQQQQKTQTKYLEVKMVLRGA